MIGGTLMLASFSAALCALTGAESVDLEERAIRVRDIVSLDCIGDPSQREHIGALVVAELPANVWEIELTRDSLATLLRRRVPSLGAIDMQSTPNRLSFSRSTGETDAPTPRNCYAAAVAIDAGAAITRSALQSTPCAHQSVRSVRFDGGSAIARAAADLAAGDYVGPLYLEPDVYADHGDALSFVVERGAVRVERRVEAVLPARGRGAFVRDADGHVFSAPLPDVKALP